VREHIPQQEQQDADGGGVEEYPQAGGRRTQPPQRHAEQDRQPGDEAKYQGLGRAHRHPPSEVSAPTE